MESAPLPQPSPLRRLSLTIVLFLTTATIGFLQPFVPLYLEAAGLTRTRIGLVLGMGTGLSLLVQPLLGHLSDRLDARRPLMFCAAISAGCAYISYHLVNGWLAFGLLSALGVSGTTYLGVAGGVLVGRMAAGTRQGGASYSRYRVWGSVGYVVIALLTGYLLGRGSGAIQMGRVSLNGLFLWGPMLFFLIALFSQGVPDSKTPSSLSISEEPSLLAPNLKRFLAAFFFYTFALYGASPYLSLAMKRLGGSPSWVTGMFVAGVICEVIVIAFVGRLSDHYGRRPLLSVSFLVLPIRLLLYIPATGSLWMLLVQCLHGLNFGIMGTLSIVFVNDLATDRTRGAMQARLAATAGLAMTLGPPTCGWLFQNAGIAWMFGIMSCIATVGLLLFFTQVEETHPPSLSLIERTHPLLHPLSRLLVAPPGKTGSRK